jgi:hypothetical protein
MNGTRVTVRTASTAELAFPSHQALAAAGPRDHAALGLVRPAAQDQRQERPGPPAGQG